MFYTLEILAKKGLLAHLWLSGAMPSKLKKRQILNADIPTLVQAVIEPTVALSQRTSAILLHGAARMWRVQAKTLLYDCNSLSAMVLYKASELQQIDLVRVVTTLTWQQS